MVDKTESIWVSKEDFIALDRILEAFGCPKQYQVTIADETPIMCDTLEKVFSMPNFTEKPIQRIFVDVQAGIGQSVSLMLCDDSLGDTVKYEISGKGTEKLQREVDAWVAEIRRSSIYSWAAKTNFLGLALIFYTAMLSVTLIVSGILVLIGLSIGELHVDGVLHFSSTRVTSVNTSMLQIAIVLLLVFMLLVSGFVQKWKSKIFPQVVFDIGYGAKREENAARLRKYIWRTISVVGVTAAPLIKQLLGF